MSRTARVAPGGLIYHVYNHGNGRLRIFNRPEEYALFVDLLTESRQACALRLLSFCLMPTHWHLVLWPRRDGDLSAFMRRVSNTHVRRWHQMHRTTGSGHVYQGRYRSFPIQAGPPLWMVMGYVEANALRSNIVRRAEDWAWSALNLRVAGDPHGLLTDSPANLPADWTQRVNRKLEALELDDLRTSVWRGRPYGSKEWVENTARQLHLERTLRHPWRPRQRIFA